MSILEAALKREKLKLQGDALPKEQRTVKCFQRLIAAMRATEAEVTDRLSDSERELNAALQQNLQLHNRIRQLEQENLQHRLKNGLAEMEVPTSARSKLLELITDGPGHEQG